jgi:hypothetical protein
VTGSQRSEKRLEERLKSSITPPTILPAIRSMLHYSPFFHFDTKAAKKYDKALVHSLAIFQVPAVLRIRLSVKYTTLYFVKIKLNL